MINYKQFEYEEDVNQENPVLDTSDLDAMSGDASESPIDISEEASQQQKILSIIS